MTSLQEGVRWPLSVLCQTCKYPGCHWVNRQKPAARNRGAAVGWLGTGSTLSPCAVALTKLWCHVSLACTSLRTACPVPTGPAGEWAAAARAANMSLAPFTAATANGMATVGSVSCSNTVLVSGHRRSRRKEVKPIPSVKPSESTPCKRLIV